MGSTEEVDSFYPFMDDTFSKTWAAMIFGAVLWLLWKFWRSNNNLSPANSFTRSLSFVGSSKGRLRWMRAVFESITNAEQMVHEGYKKFTLLGELFVLPTLNAGPVVLLPPEHLQILNRPENQVAAYEVQLEIIQSAYTMTRDKALYDDTINAGFGVVWKSLTRPKEVARFTALMEEELASAFEHHLELDGNNKWQTCKVFETLVKIIARVANRTYFGLPLCRDEQLLEQAGSYAAAVFAAAAMISLFPAWIRPVIGPVIAIKSRYHLAKCRKILIPHVQTRLGETMKADSSKDDILQLLIDDARRHNPGRLNALHLTYSLLAINQSSIYSTANALTNCLLDLFSSSKADIFVESMRQECGRVKEKFGGTLGSSEALRELRVLDSCIKESLRHGGFNTVAVMREVSAAGGIELEGLCTLPRGVRFGVPIISIHFDGRFYPAPFEFDAFRFLRHKEDLAASDVSGESAYLDRKHASTDVSREYLPWGYGRHACPGRWMAVEMMKLTMAYLLTNYDIKPLMQRPKNKPMLNVLLPPTNASVQLRRRI